MHPEYCYALQLGLSSDLSSLRGINRSLVTAFTGLEAVQHKIYPGWDDYTILLRDDALSWGIQPVPANNNVEALVGILEILISHKKLSRMSPPIEVIGQIDI